MMTAINKCPSIGSDAEFIGWRVRITSANAGSVEGTIRTFDGPTISLSDAIISYSNGHYRFLSLLDIEKEDISNLSVIASSPTSLNASATSSLNTSQLLQPQPPDSSVDRIEQPKMEEPVEEPIKAVTEEEDYPLIEIVYSCKKEKVVKEKPSKNKSTALWAGGDIQEIKNEEFDIQASLAKFDKQSEFESLKKADGPPVPTSVDPMALFRSMTLSESTAEQQEPKKDLISLNNNTKEENVEKKEKTKTPKGRKEEKSLQQPEAEFEYKPLNIINYASASHDLSIEAMCEFGGRELAAFLLPALQTTQERVSFIINASAPTFYSECCLAAIRHLLNRNIPISLVLVSLPVVPIVKEADKILSRVPLLLSRVDSVVKQGAVRCNRIKEALLTARVIIDASGGALASKVDAIVNRLISPEKLLYAVAGKTSFHPQLVNALLFFGLVEECDAQFAGKDGAFFDIGLPRGVYDAYGIRYPFIEGFTLHLSM